MVHENLSNGTHRPLDVRVGGYTVGAKGACAPNGKKVWWLPVMPAKFRSCLVRNTTAKNFETAALVALLKPSYN
jgi:hypothetical protein